jgi:Protein of unknown function (DUF2735).
MTTDMVRESAKIYEFPVRNPQRVREMQARQLLAGRVIIESGCGSWYHEEAIREERESTRTQ